MGRTKTMNEITAPGASASDPRDARRPWGYDRGILLVDDDALIRRVLGEGLRAYGFTVWQAASGREALALYECHHREIALVLLDVRMPGLDGPQTLVRLRRLNPHVRCIYMTGLLGPYAPQDLLTEGAAGVLVKPLRLSRLVEELKPTG
jgi:CheY-like chemotaxis protein